MRTLIAYATKYGGARVCAERLAALLPGETEVVELTRGAKADLASFDAVIVGTSVYMGRPRKEATQFIEQNQAALLARRLGLFLCCLQDQEKTVAEQLSLAFPQKLRMHAAAADALGGVVDYRRLKKVDAFIMNMIAGDLRKKAPQDTVSTLSDERFARFVRAFAGEGSEA